MGSWPSDTVPRRTMRIEMTMATMGRLTKNRDIMLGGGLRPPSEPPPERQDCAGQARARSGTSDRGRTLYWLAPARCWSRSTYFAGVFPGAAGGVVVGWAGSVGGSAGTIVGATLSPVFTFSSPSTM